MARNRFEVPAKQWRRWSATAQIAFSTVYSSMVNNQWAYLHPEQAKVKREHWRTTAWNAAWLAANTTDGIGTKVIK